MASARCIVEPVAGSTGVLLPLQSQIGEMVETLRGALSCSLSARHSRRPVIEG